MDCAKTTQPTHWWLMVCITDQAYDTHLVHEDEAVERPHLAGGVDERHVGVQARWRQGAVIVRAQQHRNDGDDRHQRPQDDVVQDSLQCRAKCFEWKVTS